MKSLLTGIILTTMVVFNAIGKTHPKPDNIITKENDSIVKLIFDKWEKTNKNKEITSTDLFECYKENKKYIKKTSKEFDNNKIKLAYKINDYNFTNSLGKYYYYKGEEVYLKEKKTLKKLPKIYLNDTSINALLEDNKFHNIVEYIYFLNFLKEGIEFNNAKGGFFSNTSVPTISNKYDYKKLKSIFSLDNEKIKEHYLNKLKFFFRYNGYTKGLAELKPYIEKNCPDSKLKKEIWDLYDKYYHLQEGMPAPAFKLPSHRGKEVSLSDYKGKVVVIDVWATWCGGCIKKLPKFLKIKEMYKDNKEIVFLTISIDRFSARLKWKYSLPKYKLMGTTNLIAYADRGTFSQDYNITGIPRYFVIDREGKIVNVYCPTPGDHFKSIIDKTLAK